jgi:hypothetical protein
MYPPLPSSSACARFPRSHLCCHYYHLLKV